MRPRPRSARWPAHIASPPHPARAAALAAILAAASAGCASATSGPPNASPKPTAHRSAPASPTFTTFAGDWSGHGSYLIVHRDGSFTMGARTYRTCGQGPPPCDTFSGNTITDGDVATGRLTHVSGEAATGTITHTTDPADTPTGSVTMTLDPATDTLSVRNTSFCGPSAPADTCGA